MRRSIFDRFTGLYWLAAYSVFSLATIMPQPASGLTITWTDKATSGFDLAETAVVEAAITAWEVPIMDLGPLSGFRTTLSVSITETPTAGIGAAFSLVADPAGIPSSGSITIDDGTFTGAFGGFFVDPTPGEDAEYDPSTFGHYGTATLGGPAASKKDLLTVVQHELGHVLGFDDAYTLWLLRITSPDTLLYDAIPPTTTAALSDPDHLAHIDLAQPFDLMATAGDLPTDGIGDRRLQSGLDLDILEGIYFYTVDRTSLRTISGPSTVPEPSTLVLLGAGLVSLLGYGRRRTRNSGWGRPVGMVRLKSGQESLRERLSWAH